MSDLKSFASLPKHVAIIMDGNNRWAKARRLPSLAGHKAGVDAVRAMVDGCARYEVASLTLFAFSSENWKRPPAEVTGLMELFMLALKREVKKLHKNNIRLRVIGDKTRFSDKLQRKIAEAEALTAGNTGLCLNIAANYGGQWDIAQASRLLAEKVQAGELEPEQINEASLAQHLCLADQPLPDLCIRTGGERRISNFLLWQFAYAELYFTSTLWPDFDRAELEAAFEDFSGRQRRFGKTSEQVEAEQQHA
ncbi:di-trans,poly-cis-decaprenylcistransferase [Motiliproteus coralliicola]|uniref:Ditrans,polycis-undecaprenyl-diphosphate synthase ((2E,6E)-farnesyl-diphosphate specific) n=1 Tax=Motiliproteus coralliicola TaxID=2283196 RepID=A0A369WD22_9GAMM|nr:polyprenyl diphosphate synthase [Motiliproteus coralliicola]RDE18516.1 di-trans,poly-cis-decaprenylcistransferase [Motiliproteus coralliicola]